MSCPFTVLVGEQDPVVTTVDAAAWRAHTTADTEVRVFPGGHFYLDGSTEAVAEIIAARLGGRPVHRAPADTDG